MSGLSVMRLLILEKSIFNPLQVYSPFTTNKKAVPQLRNGFFVCGGDRSRTGVQTYSPKAFYMFILFC